MTNSVNGQKCRDSITQHPTPTRQLVNDQASRLSSRTVYYVISLERPPGIDTTSYTLSGRVKTWVNDVPE